MAPSFAVLNDPRHSEVLRALAARHGWPLVETDDGNDFLLRWSGERLELIGPAREREHPVAVDFLSGNLAHRRRFGLSKQQPIAKAIGARAGLKVVDATAGLGVDAFFMACLGCDVTAVERSPVAHALLEDGYRRALADAELAAEVLPRLRLVFGDAGAYLKSLAPDARPDVVYFDPMYPESKKSALPKKEMRLFRELIGSDPDTEATLAVALDTARERVVVKRPVGAEPLLRKPTHSYEGKTARYDMYSLARGLSPCGR